MRDPILIAYCNIFLYNQEAIEVPQQFVTDWKDLISLNNIGSIKDPADNFFEIDISTILTEFTINVGLVISYHCGFQQPHKVILDYQPNFNQFDMRIINDQGIDIPCLRFHNPINQHALKFAEPSYKVNPQFISK